MFFLMISSTHPRCLHRCLPRPIISRVCCCGPMGHDFRWLRVQPEDLLRNSVLQVLGEAWARQVGLLDDHHDALQIWRESQCYVGLPLLGCEVMSWFVAQFTSIIPSVMLQCSHGGAPGIRQGDQRRLYTRILAVFETVDRSGGEVCKETRCYSSASQALVGRWH